MFRLFKAELKKIFLKPSIFVVTGLLIFMLAFSTFMYSPKTRDVEYVSYKSESGQTVGWYDTKFKNSSSNELDSKLSFDEKLVYVQNNILDFYKLKNDSITTIKSAWNDVKAKYASSEGEPTKNFEGAYRAWKSSPTDENKNNLVIVANDYLQKLKNFQQLYQSIAQSVDRPTILTTSEINSKIDNYVNKVNGFFNNSETDKYAYILSQITNTLNREIKIDDELSKIMPFYPEENVLDDLQQYIDTAKVRCNGILSEMDTYLQQQGVYESKDLREIKKYVTNYKWTVQNAYNIVVNSIKVSGMSKYTALNITNYSGFENYNYYEFKEALTKTKYLFDNNKFDYQYASPLSIAQPSNQSPNAFDFSYFALKFCTFFIIVYIVVLSAGTIAGEQSAGTLKLLAIRPYSRNKLLTAKILSILAIAAILLTVSSVASLVIGGIYYGFGGAMVLATFNATKSFLISPVVMYLIAFLFMLVEISFYILLSVFISTVFKTNIGAVSVSTLIFFVSLVLNVVAVQVPALSFIPFANINLFKYFGSSFLTNSSSVSFYESVLTPTVFAGSSFWFSFGILIFTTALIVYVTYLLFKRRDIK